METKDFVYAFGMSIISTIWIGNSTNDPQKAKMDL